MMAGLGLAACGGSDGAGSDDVAASGDAAASGDVAAGADSGKVPVVVFADAALAQVLPGIGELFGASFPEYAPSFTFDASSALAARIQQGEDCDVFVPAGAEAMDQLDIEADPSANDEGTDAIDHASRLDLLEDHIMLAVPDGNPKRILDFNDFAARLACGELLTAVGNADDATGRCAQKILVYYGIDQAVIDEQQMLVYGATAQDVVAWVKEGAVDCGIVCQSEVQAAGLMFVGTATEEMCGRLVYPAAACKRAAQPEAAAEFLGFLTGAEAATAFEKAGFTLLAQG